jgi:hypothetical protein
VAEPAKTANKVLATTSFFVVGLVVGLLFFMLVKRRDRGRVRLYGLIVGVVGGLFSLVVARVEGAGTGATAKILNIIWILGLFSLWGVALGQLDHAVYPLAKPVPQAAPAAPAPKEPGPAAPSGQASVLSRRRFLVEAGGLVATIVVAGAGLSEVLRSRAWSARVYAATSSLVWRSRGACMAHACHRREPSTTLHLRTSLLTGLLRGAGSDLESTRLNQASTLILSIKRFTSYSRMSLHRLLETMEYNLIRLISASANEAGLRALTKTPGGSTGSCSMCSICRSAKIVRRSSTS